MRWIRPFFVFFFFFFSFSFAFFFFFFSFPYPTNRSTLRTPSYPHRPCAKGQSWTSTYPRQRNGLRELSPSLPASSALAPGLQTKLVLMDVTEASPPSRPLIFSTLCAHTNESPPSVSGRMCHLVDLRVHPSTSPQGGSLEVQSFGRGHALSTFALV